ncbi:MAG: sulfatase-like hydrolase/transferase [Lentisphaerae bacterium]|nr:sulfatase-like hydrolase/transferase [Lentisphaerota bacterium]MBT7841094.1 sulfatase-like hydrolase/transferase [Lentisphaerota bacterium]
MAFCPLKLTALPPSTRRPNIVFFILDDMQRYMFNCLPEGRGKNLTPTIDRLAAEGTLLLGQHVASPVCTPSRYNCLTGNYASRALEAQARNQGQTVVTWNTHIATHDDNLPKQLRQAGYTTGIVGKNHVLSVPGWKKIPYEADPTQPDARAQLKSNAAKVQAAFKQAGFDYVASIYHNNPDGNGAKALAVHNLDWIAQGAVDFIDQNHERPFFLYFASTIPHGPGQPKRAWNADPRATADGFLHEAPNVLPQRPTLPKRLREAGIKGWEKENMLWLDDAVGAVMKKLEEHGIADNTIVFFFNDHGQAAKGTLYQGGVTNPSIVWRKGGFPCGSVNRALVSNIDFAPTILDYAGAGIKRETFDGHSLKPLLEGQTQTVRESLYFEMGYTRAVRKGDWKYLALRYTEQARKMPLAKRKQILERVNKNLLRRSKKVHSTNPEDRFSHISLVPGGGDAEHGSMGKYPAYYDNDQLYNLAEDPKEQRNLARDPAYAEKLAEMKRELRGYLAKLPGGFGDLKTP